MEKKEVFNNNMILETIAALFHELICKEKKILSHKIVCIIYFYHTPSLKKGCLVPE